MSPVTIPGDGLVAYLEGAGADATEDVRVHPAPRRWSDLKPAVLGHARARWGRGKPPARLSGYPLCAIGNEWREIRVRPQPGPAPSPCGGCARRDVCSPPEAFSEEMQPFGPTDPLASWRAYRTRLSEAGDLAVAPALDALVARSVSVMTGPLAGMPCTLEPSIVLGDGLEPVVRLAIFHGDLPEDPAAAVEAHRMLADCFAALHADAGTPMPPGLLDTLLDHGPVPLPLGFEAPADADPMLKAYLRLETRPPEARRDLTAALLALAGSSQAPDIPWEDVEMIGLGTRAGRLVSVKAYVRATPGEGWARWDLPAVDPCHPAMRLSFGRALATLDLHAPAPRPPKWDFHVRDALIPGVRAAEIFAPVLSSASVATVRALLAHHDFRTDVVAVAVRGDRLALYAELC